MSTIKLAGIALIALGVLALAYGGFTYTQDTHEAQVGPIEISVAERKTINIPIWAGVGGILIGGVLLFVGSKNT